MKETNLLLKLLIVSFLFLQIDLKAQNDDYLDVVTYNIEWLGVPSKAGLRISRSEQIRKAANDIIDAGADVYALQEIVTDSRNGDALTDLVNKLNQLDNEGNWEGVYNQRFSYWWNPNFSQFPAQRQAFVYKTSTVKKVSASTMLTSQISSGSSLFASGRLPFRLEADVTIKGKTQRIHFICLHLKCCSGNASRRRSSMRMLVDELADNYANKNVVILGDFNVADDGGSNGEIETWGVYDDKDYNSKPDYYHAAGVKSSSSWNNIDHVLISDELNDEYQATPPSLRNKTLKTTVSDHKPVATKLKFSGNGGGGTDPDPDPNPDSGSELFISEYIEGSSYNKAIEIANFTGSSANLSDYSLKLASNGNGWTQQVTLSGNLGNGEVFVIAHERATSEIKNKADLINSSVINFNGNDAVGLFKDRDVLIDIVGVYRNSADYGKNKTLVRKSTVTAPSTKYNASEWNQYSMHDFSNLGSHTIEGSKQKKAIADNGGLYKIEKGNVCNFMVYPNPSGDFIKITSKVDTQLSVKIYNLSGRKVKSSIIYSNDLMNISELKSGTYILKVNDGESTSVQKVVKH